MSVGLMRVFQNKPFRKWAANEGLDNSDLWAAVEEMENGLVGDSLGANLYKKRIGLNNKGKSGGRKIAMESKILKNIHEMAQDLKDAGVMDKQTMREFDAICIPAIKHYSKDEIKRIRESQNASQAVFAQYLNTTPSTIRSWEHGEKKPSGAALKLLNLVEKKGLAILI